MSAIKLTITMTATADGGVMNVEVSKKVNPDIIKSFIEVLFANQAGVAQAALEANRKAGEHAS